MSDWYWKVIVLKAAFVLSCFASYLRADDNVQKLPFCNPSNLKDGLEHNDLMIVSTLDGKLTAFSTQNGIKVWDIETQPLLSSNLHNLELTSGGKWVRLVPSLRGSLYSLSGETIEPLPFDAEQLLSSSYKYSDDLVIAGARESLWVGIDAHTGAVIYECGSRGCDGERAAAGARQLIVMRRHSHTVRAVDPRAGNEKWNFSVAEHQLALSRGGCVEAAPIPATPIAVAVALHDGRVAIRNPGDYRLIWQQKLEAPVAGMWRLQGGALENIDVVWEATQTIASGVTQQPSLYIGVHNTQLYIQESPFYTRKLETSTSVSPVPWKLVAGRPLIEADTALSVVSDKSLSQVAEYGPKGLAGDYGFFLYLQETCDQSVQTSEADIDRGDATDGNASDDHDHHHIHVHVYSLWFWWKEVLLIAVSSALLMNLMIWPRFFAPKLPPLGDGKSGPPLSRSDMVGYDRYPTQLQATHRVAMTHISALPPTVERTPSVPEYSGRYETDFTPLRCLGRGGFGVVFEVRNNIDHCCYALKRITLPRKEKKRERVRREVRALAKLEHVNIVRYFNAWEERPPPPAQQLRDIALIRELDSQSALSEYTSTPLSSPAKSPNAKGDSVILNLHKHFDTELLDYKLHEPSKRNRSHSCSDSIVFDSEAPGGDRSSAQDRGLSPQSEDRGLSPRSKDRGSSGLSEAKHNPVDMRLARVQECDYKTDSSTPRKKKKGHTRHWSLDACVLHAGGEAAEGEAPLYLYIQMQLCRRDSLHDWLRANRSPQQRHYSEIKSLFSQIVSAVDYVHKAGLIHRDLKPSNILFSQDGVVKVGDFGLVTSMGDASQEGERPEEMDAYQRHTYRVGTHLYMSPEQVQCRPYSYKVDIYSLGLILFELLQPFGTESERVRCLEDVKRGKYPQGFKERYPNEVEALELMLSADPSRRPTALGVRARAPLFDYTDERHHFTLPAIAVSA